MIVLLPVLAVVVLVWFGFVMFLCDDNRVVIPRTVRISEGFRAAAEQFNKAMQGVIAASVSAVEAIRRLNAVLVAIGRSR